MALIADLKTAVGAGRTDAGLSAAREFQREAQFDFVDAENSTDFHAPQDAGPVLGESIDFARTVRSPSAASSAIADAL